MTQSTQLVSATPNLFEGELFGQPAMRRWLRSEITKAGPSGLAITARRFGVTRGVLSNIVNCGREVGPELALRFGFELHNHPVFVPVAAESLGVQS